MRIEFLTSTVLSLAVLFAGAAHAGSATDHVTTRAAAAGSHPTSPSVPVHKVQSEHGSGWSYQGETGPERWERLSRDYAVCGQGETQSPIDLTGKSPAGSPAGDIRFNYRLTPVHILNNGHTVQVNYTAGSTMTVEGKTFEVSQFHFHAPSEHAINGRLADMEMHIVHKNDAGELAVAGVLMNIGKENLALREVWQNLPTAVAAEKVNERDLVNVRDFLPSDAKYFRYMGSLTTPPCTEGVNWFVMAEPMEVSAEQVAKFTRVFGANNRPLQAVNNRLLLAPGNVN